MESKIESKQDFENVLRNKTDKVIFKFTADWCGPCKKAKPIIDENLKKLPESILFNEVDLSLIHI